MSIEQEIAASVDQFCLHPSGKYTVYRLVIKFLSKNNNTENITYKRFSDFVSLHRHLSQIHKAFGSRQHFPTLSKYDHFDRFNPRLIEERRQALDSFVKFIARNEHLYCHTYFTRFVAAGFSIDASPCFSGTCVQFNQSFSCPDTSTSFPSSRSDSIISFPAVSGEISIPERIVEPPLAEQFESPLSSDVDSEHEGDTLPLVWMCSETQYSKILQDIISARIFVVRGSWCEAYESYKNVVSNLLQKINSNPADMEGYRCLLSACLSNVEYIYREHLENSGPKNNHRKEGEEKPACPRWFESPSLACLCQDTALSKLFGSVEKLSKLEICGIDGKDLVVCESGDISVKYTLKSRSLSPFDVIAPKCPAIASTDFKSSRLPERILPIGQVPFMSSLHRLVEVPNRSRVFILVKRTRGELRLVEWLSDYLQERIRLLLSKDSVGRRNLGLALKHLDWCKVRSSRIRAMIENCLNQSIENGHNSSTNSMLSKSSSGSCNFINDSSMSSLDELRIRKLGQSNSTQNKTIKCSKFLPSPLLTPKVLLARHPPYILPLISRSRSYDHFQSPNSTTHKTRTSIFTADGTLDRVYENTMQVLLLPERRAVLWAAQLVSVVSWLHDHHIMLRSSVYLTNCGHIEIDYFFRWTDSDQADDPKSCAPELLIGDLSRSFLCSRSWEKCVACDWWSVGVILYEVFTGIQLTEVYPCGLTCDEPLQFPCALSANVRDFLSKLLRLNPNERLSGSVVKDHPVFALVDWSFTEENVLN